MKAVGVMISLLYEAQNSIGFDNVKRLRGQKVKFNLQLEFDLKLRVWKDVAVVYILYNRKESVMDLHIMYLRDLIRKRNEIHKKTKTIQIYKTNFSSLNFISIFLIGKVSCIYLLYNFCTSFSIEKPFYIYLYLFIFNLVYKQVLLSLSYFSLYLYPFNLNYKRG